MTTVGERTPILAEASRDDEAATHVIPYRTYWVSWSVLLVLTVVMLVTETVSLARGAVLTLLLGAMLVKAGVIVTWFMHLRFERVALVLAVVGAVALTAMAMFGLLAPDAVSLLHQTGQ